VPDAVRSGRGPARVQVLRPPQVPVPAVPVLHVPVLHVPVPAVEPGR